MASHSIPFELPVHHVSPFDDDDPFTVSDHPSNLVIQDVAWTNTNVLQSSSAFQDQNTSVSTLDINGYPHKSPISPNSNSSVLSSEFSQISLSNDHYDVDPSPDPDDHGQSDAPYPSVVIDASDAPTHTVTLTLDHIDPTPRSPPPQLSPATSTRSLPPETMTRTSGSETQHESASASTPTIPPLSIATNTHQSSLSSEKPQSPIQKPTGHRPSRSTGPSMFEKVRSKTRPNFLPPKPKAEDEKHLADWQNMMKLSRAAGPFTE